MKAAVVASFAASPAYGEFAEPEARAGEAIVAVRYAARSSLAKAQAAGKHYSAATTPPFVPGVDGVGTLDGGRVYFAFPRGPYGSMAERVPVDRRYCIALPDGLDDETAAAAGNPGMSSFTALTLRARMRPGESVLINGATGVSGRLAVSVAKHLGAKHVVATGRNPAMLERVRDLGADRTISLSGDSGELAASLGAAIRECEIGIVLDYLWGAPATAIFEALSGHGGAEAEPRVRIVQIGSSAGDAIAMSAKNLRSSGIELMGTGLGSVSYERLVAATAEFFEAFVAGGFATAHERLPLADVADSWNRAPSGDARVVYEISPASHPDRA